MKIKSNKLLLAGAVFILLAFMTVDCFAGTINPKPSPDESNPEMITFGLPVEDGIGIFGNDKHLGIYKYDNENILYQLSPNILSESEGDIGRIISLIGSDMTIKTIEERGEDGEKYYCLYVVDLLQTSEDEQYSIHLNKMFKLDENAEHIVAGPDGDLIINIIPHGAISSVDVYKVVNNVIIQDEEGNVEPSENNLELFGSLRADYYDGGFSTGCFRDAKMYLAVTVTNSSGTQPTVKLFDITTSTGDDDLPLYWASQVYGGYLSDLDFIPNCVVDSENKAFPVFIGHYIDSSNNYIEYKLYQKEDGTMAEEEKEIFADIQENYYSFYDFFNDTDSIMGEGDSFQNYRSLYMFVDTERKFYNIFGGIAYTVDDTAEEKWAQRNPLDPRVSKLVGVIYGPPPKYISDEGNSDENYNYIEFGLETGETITDTFTSNNAFGFKYNFSVGFWGFTSTSVLNITALTRILYDSSSSVELSDISDIKIWTTNDLSDQTGILIFQYPVDGQTNEYSLTDVSGEVLGLTISSTDKYDHFTMKFDLQNPGNDDLGDLISDMMPAPSTYSPLEWEFGWLVNWGEEDNVLNDYADSIDMAWSDGASPVVNTLSYEDTKTTSLGIYQDIQVYVLGVGGETYIGGGSDTVNWHKQKTKVSWLPNGESKEYEDSEKYDLYTVILSPPADLNIINEYGVWVPKYYKDRGDNPFVIFYETMPRANEMTL